MTRLSSNWTLFYKFFLPTFWIVFVGACVAATWAMNISFVAGIQSTIFGIVLTVFYVLGIFLFYLFSMRLKRVEIDENYIYITNYFKNYRYPHIDIDYIQEPTLPVFSAAKLYLKSAGSLGKEIKYIAVKGWLQDFLAAHPEVEIEVR
ncbi:MAG: hypothetical protein AAF849_13605 [Bacteroidota bacterium]